MNSESCDLISIVMSTYNRGHIIKRTIDSVLKQTYTNFELIIVDDASEDNTNKVVNSYSDHRIKYIKLPENTKGTKPRNIGINQSKGKFIALLDSDDEWVPEKLETQLNFIKKIEEENFLCFTDVIIKEEKRNRVSKNKEVNNKDILEYIIVEDNFVQTSTYMFPSKLGKETLFADDVKKHQDWDFCLRMQLKGAKFILLNEPLTIYHVDKSEKRIATDRKYNLSIYWINKIKDNISEKTYYAFLAKKVASTLLMNNKKKTALSYYFKAFQTGAINLNYLIKGVIKCCIPSSLFIRWKK